MSSHYEVLSPWADTEPVPVKGLSSRLADLNEKTLGLFSNNRGSSLPILNILKEKLQANFPSLKFSHFILTSGNLEATEKEAQDRATFEEWIKGVDAVFAAFGD